MIASEKIKQKILIESGVDGPIGTAEQVYIKWGEAAEECSDIKGDFRSGDVETGLPCEYSRHYESKAVAAQMVDGSWVGWTYWYGGGKHGEPEAIDWIDDAYDLDVTEEEKLVVVRTWKKKEKANVEG